MNTSMILFDIRSFAGEVRMLTAPSGKKKVTGYAAVFDAASQLLRDEEGEPFVETVRKGAFQRSLKESDVRGLYNHDTKQILGRRGSGTLRLGEDSRGLEYEIDLGNRSYDRDLEESLERGDVFGSSFSFNAYDDDWSESSGGIALRELRGVHLFDVGPVVFPAYKSATATCRSLKTFVEARSARGATPAPPPLIYPTPDQINLLNWFNVADL